MPARVPEPFDDSPLECALTYAQCGIRVLPIKPGEKRPPMPAWQDAATVDAATIRNWFKGLYGGHGVGLAMGWQPDGRCLFAVDVDEHDPARSGSETLDRLEHEHGRLPDTVRAITGADGAHLLFVSPFEVRNGNIGDGLDVRGHGGQIVVHPTTHPTTGRRYEWEADCAPWDRQIADAPTWLLELVRPPAAPLPVSTPTSTPSTGDTPADHLRASWNWPDELQRAGWILHHTEPNGDTHWTRPGKDRREGSSAVLHPPDGPLVVWSTDAALRPLWSLGTPAGGAGTAVTPLDFRAHTDHGGDIGAASRAIRASITHEGFAVAPSHVDPTTGEILADPRNLPDDFWQARYDLDHIRRAAHSRARSADAVLLCVLARLAATIPPQIRLPAIVGSEASLNFLAALIGISGAGKTTAAAVARELAPIDRSDVVADVPLGSGEGLVELFFELVEEEGPDGKTRKVKRQTKSGAYIVLGEGQALGEMGGRKGATLLPTLRDAWSGDTLGQSNATAETHRVLKPHTYRLAMVTGFQVDHASGLLDDAAGGTPQRFVFASAVDPNVPDDRPDWPGAIDMTPPVITSGAQHIGVATAIADEIWQHNLAVTRGQTTADPLDSHALLVRLKVAALLSNIDGRLDVNAEDWQLAAVLMQTSNAVRGWVAEAASARARAVEIEGHRKAARRELIVGDSTHDRALERASRAVGRRAQKTETLSRREIARAIASRDLRTVSVEEVIDEAIRMQWIEPLLDGWKAGKARPS